ncbi:MAG: phosphatidate cytidylyltransferase [Caldimicrobium sp.]
MNSNFVKRTLSTLILFPLLVFLILKGPTLLLFLCLFLCVLIAWYEWGKLFDFSLPFLVYGFLLLFGAFYALNKFSPLYITFFLLVGSFAPLISNFQKETFDKKFFPLFLGIIYLFIGFGSLKILIQGYNRELILFLFTVVFANDTGAYLVGKKWGDTPFFPEISPKKTWEGFFGGVAFALLVALGLNFFLLSLPLLSLLTLALMLAFIGVMGDLFESAVKRLVGKKDSGALIPGHGGLLDRIDGVLWAAPMFLFFLEVLNYGIYFRLGL